MQTRTREATRTITLQVNGVEYTNTIPVRKTLVDFLREDLSLTGSHVGCEHGVCGACNVLLDGQVVRSCIMFAVQADGHQITTIEGLGTVNNLHVLQKAFWDNHGMQCGYCTPGMIIAAYDLLKNSATPSEEEIREAIGGNLCRCTGYMQIVEAIQDAAGRLAQLKRPLTP